jgi:hypothetical protein
LRCAATRPPAALSTGDVGENEPPEPRVIDMLEPHLQPDQVFLDLFDEREMRASAAKGTR